MFIEIVDALRCPRPHADSWLVAAAVETRDRCLVRGTLGCPVCHTEYAIVDGVVDFASDDAAADVTDDVADHEPGDEAMRLAALLDLSTAGGTIAVGGTWDRALDPLLDLADVRAFVLEPVDRWIPREPLGAVRGALLPIAPASLRGVALDLRTASSARLAAAVQGLRARGRLVAPAAAPLPDGVRELARDARHWVAERMSEPASGLVPLRRAR